MSLFKQAQQIIEGWRNELVPPEALKEMIKEVSSARLDICKDCKFNTTPGKVDSFSKCSLCGCWLRPKSKCLSCNCGIEKYNQNNPSSPMELKWTAIATDEEDDQIEKAIS